MTVHEIKPEILSWILGQVNPDKMKEETLQRINDWQNGIKKPTFHQISELSKETKIPLGYFFLNTPLVEDYSFMEYRTIDSQKFKNPSRDLIDVIHNMENIQDWMREYLIQSDESPLSFVGSQKDNKNVLDVAKKIRGEMNLEMNWFEKSKRTEDSFKTIREAAQKIGILVMKSSVVRENTHRALDVEEFRAFTMIDAHAPLIFINTRDSVNAQLFSLLHEIAHIWYGNNNIFNNPAYKSNEKVVSKDEMYCNAIANEILVPNEMFTTKWTGTDMEPAGKIQALSEYFKCSTTVIARNALDCGYIKKPLYEKIAEEAAANYLKTQKTEKGGGNRIDTIASHYDRRFLMSLSTSVYSGKTLFTDAFKLTNTRHKTFIKLMDKISGEECKNAG
ncbi:MAG: ImmA/IrrE family metallo-endopeptidase [Methanimicrococcus sp.]|nr:ImmA/IrrE family metallo-endopeptidase [Methanimicrococcus sp.]